MSSFQINALIVTKFGISIHPFIENQKEDFPSCLSNQFENLTFATIEHFQNLLKWQKDSSCIFTMELVSTHQSKGKIGDDAQNVFHIKSGTNVWSALKKHLVKING